jgi:hypothetical protein
MLTDLNSKTLKAEISMDGRIILKCVVVCVRMHTLQIEVSVVGCCERGNEPSGCLIVG